MLNLSLQRWIVLALLCLLSISFPWQRSINSVAYAQPQESAEDAYYAEDGYIEEEPVASSKASGSLAGSRTSNNPFEQMFGESLYMWGFEGEGSEKELAIFEAGTAELLNRKKVVAVYFSASWCPPCRQFTPVLAKLYGELNKRRPGQFEVVWVSGDRTQEDFLAYYKKMPWLAVTLQQIQPVMQRLSPK